MNLLQSSKFMEQLHCNRWSDIADCLTFLRRFPVRLEIPMCSEIDFKLKKAILDLDFLISCRKNSVFLKFLQFKVCSKQLRASKAYISCQKTFT